MKVYYTRGNFRVIKNQRGFGYQVQAQDRNHLAGWHDIFCSFDYLGNARQRVRNLHAACCTHLEVCESKDLDFPGRRYIKTGKLAKSRMFRKPRTAGKDV